MGCSEGTIEVRLGDGHQPLFRPVSTEDGIHTAAIIAITRWPIHAMHRLRYYAHRAACPKLPT
jgi:hypothetical protein